MNVVILGAAGRTGRLLVEKGLAKGYRLTALLRSASAPPFDPAVRVVTGDARSEADLVRALRGQDAILSTLGSEQAGDELIKRFTQALVASSDLTGVKRVVMLSTFLLTPNYKPNLVGQMIGRIRKGVDQDKTSGEDILRSSDLDWTIVYATRLDARPPGEIRIVKRGETVGLSDGIARADVGEFMLRTLSAAATTRKSILITAR